MKRSVYVCLLCCVLLIGCGGRQAKEYVDETGQINNTKPVAVTDTPTPFSDADARKTPEVSDIATPVAIVTASVSESTLTPTATVAPAHTPTLPPTSIPTLTPTVAPTSIPTQIPASPVPPFDFSEIGVESYWDDNGREVYETATFFFDENGLLCVGVKAIYNDKSNLFEAEKIFYLPNQKIYRETILVSEAELRELLKKHIVKETNKTVVYEPVVIETIGNHVWTTSGKLVETSALLGEDQKSKFVCTPEDGFIPVKEGDVFRMSFHFSWFPQVGGIVFFDQHENVIQTYAFDSATKISNREIVVPKNSVKMHLSLYANQEYRIERKTVLLGADLNTITEESYIEQSLKKMLEVSADTTKKYTLDKAYITFVLDDCRPDMDRIANIFEMHKIPLCIAAVHENMLFPASMGEETRRQVCERVVAEGGEVLSHDGEVITEQSIRDYSELTEQFYEDKWVLKQMGFDVNGIILAGGTGQLVGHPVTDLFAKTFYQYSDLYGNADAGEPYYHRRIWLGNCLDSYERIIEDAIREKKWVVLYFHDLKEINTEKLQEILTYVNTISEKDAEVITYKSMYDMMWQ